MKCVQRSIFAKSAWAGLVGVFFLGSAVAHHGFGSYLEEEFRLTGTVVDMYFGFPHPHLLVEADGEQWDVWLAAFGRVKYVCLPEILTEGDQVTAVGHRVPDQRRLEMKAKTVSIGEDLYDFYPSENPPGGNANPKRTSPCPT